MPTRITAHPLPWPADITQGAVKGNRSQAPYKGAQNALGSAAGRHPNPRGLDKVREVSIMSVLLYRLAGVGLACVLASSASAELLARKDLSANTAITIAQTAIATCTANGYRVSATVVGRNGEVIVQIRGDGTGPHTMENSFKK